MAGNSARWSGEGEGLWNEVVGADKRISRWLAQECVPRSLHGVKRWSCVALEYSGHGVPWIILGIYVLKTIGTNEGQALAVNFLLGLVLDLLLICGVKALAARPRPPYNESHIMLSVAVDRNNAFPSGHATRAVFVVAFCAGYVSTSMLVWTAIWAALICTSRVLMGRHHLIDVVAAVPFGILEAVIALRWLGAVGVTDFFLAMWT